MCEIEIGLPSLFCVGFLRYASLKSPCISFQVSHLIQLINCTVDKISLNLCRASHTGCGLGKRLSILYIFGPHLLINELGNFIMVQLRQIKQMLSGAMLNFAI